MSWAEIAYAINSSIKKKELTRPLNIMLIQLTLAEAFNEETCAWALKQYDIGYVIDAYLRINSEKLRQLVSFEDVCNDWTYVTNIVNSPLYDKIIKYCDWPMAKIMAGASGAAAGFENVTAVLNSEVAMTAVVNSEVAMTAVLNSEVAMTAVANSEVAMTAVLNSEVAMTAVLNSEVALAGISKVTNSSTLFNWLKKVNETTAYITAIANTMQKSTLFTNSYNGGHDSVSGANNYFSSGNVIGLCCCGYYSSSSDKVNMALNNTTVFTGKTGYSRPSTGSTNTNAIAIRGCTFTETNDAYLGISVYTLK
nr:MAG TPA: Tail fiber protein [Caudoviricetes sp.]